MEDQRVIAYKACQAKVEAWQTYFRTQYACDTGMATRAQVQITWRKLWTAHVAEKRAMRIVREYRQASIEKYRRR